VSARAFIVFLALLAGIGLMAFGMLNGSGGQTLATGAALPVRDLPTMDQSATGSVADHAGDWVLVNFWASWCGPCKDEAPVIEKFHAENEGDNFTVLGIDTLDNREDGSGFITRHKLTFPMLHDGSGDYHKALGMTGVPETVLVDPEGNVALYRPGPVTAGYLHDFVLPLINGEQSVGDTLNPDGPQ